MNFLSVLNDFKNLGCTEQAKCALACRVYLDLMLDKKYCSVDKSYNKALDVIILHAEDCDKKKYIILPALVSQELDLGIVNKLKKETTTEDCGLLLALCDTTSNILYYRLFED